MRHTLDHSWGKKALVAVALTGFLMLSAAPRSRANEKECQHRLAKADHRLHEAAEHHGWESEQAEHLAMSCGKLASTAGTPITAGGMKTATAGTPTATGMITITTTTATKT